MVPASCISNGELSMNAVARAFAPPAFISFGPWIYNADSGESNYVRARVQRVPKRGCN